MKLGIAISIARSSHPGVFATTGEPIEARGSDVEVPAASVEVPGSEITADPATNSPAETEETN